MFQNIFRNSKVDKAVRQIAAMQNIIDNLSVALTNSIGGKGRGRYSDYQSQIRGLREKFNGTDPLGGDICRTVIQLRTAFIKGSGFTVVNKTDDAKNRTFVFMQQFAQYNKLTTGFLNTIIRGGEFEGKVLLVLERNRKDKQIRVRYVPFTTNAYAIATDKNDYSVIESVTFTQNNRGENITLTPKQFVFVKLGGDVDNNIETYPRLGVLLESFESYDHALRDWRKINSIYSSPTPHLNFEDATTAREFEEREMAKPPEQRFVIGKLLVTANATFTMVNAGNESQKSLAEEILTLGKVISAGSGIPVHFLGLPELMSNRSVADNLRELLSASIEDENSVWEQAVNELKDKVIDMVNSEFELGLDKEAVEIRLPYVGQQEMENINKILLPIRNSGAMSTKTFLDLLPFIHDPLAEMELIKKEAEEMPKPDQNLPGVDTRKQSVSDVTRITRPSGNSNQGVA